jgi:hypothetical protein
MSLTVVILLASWLGLNVAFVAIRLYVTADPTSDTSADLIRYPRSISSLCNANRKKYPPKIVPITLKSR